MEPIDSVQINKPFYYWTYDPTNSIFGKKSDKASYTVLLCPNCHACEAFQNHQCGLYGAWSNCPVGKKMQNKGPTHRSKDFYTFLNKPSKLYPEAYTYESYKLRNLDSLCFVGPNREYIYLPLDHLNNYVNPIVDKYGIRYGHYLPSDKFTPELVVELFEYMPIALMGGHITIYKDKLPSFAYQLNRKFPDIWKRAGEINDSISQYLIKLDYRKRKAYLKTLLPGKVEYNNKIVEWDGKLIKAKSGDLMLFSSDSPDDEIIITPNENTIVKIVDNDTVDPDKVALVMG